jgi:hypothetical protein
LHPVVRYMILCDDWASDPANARRINIFGLLITLHSLDQPPFPLLHREMCVFLALTEGRGEGEAKIVCTFEETGERIFETPPRRVTFGSNPLAVKALPFRIRDCHFPVVS